MEIKTIGTISANRLLVIFYTFKHSITKRHRVFKPKQHIDESICRQDVMDVETVSLPHITHSRAMSVFKDRR